MEGPTGSRSRRAACWESCDQQELDPVWWMDGWIDGRDLPGNEGLGLLPVAVRGSRNQTSDSLHSPPKSRSGIYLMTWKSSSWPSWPHPP